MSELDTFNELAAALRETYNADGLQAVRAALESVIIDDEEKAKLFCRGLDKLQSKDSAELLASKWADMDKNARTIILRWGWGDDNKDKTLSGHVYFTQRIWEIDRQIAISIIEKVIKRNVKSPAEKEHFLKALRNSWVYPDAKSGNLPISTIEWKDLPESVSIDFVEYATEAFQTISDKKRPNSFLTAKNNLVAWVDACRKQAHDNVVAERRLLKLRDKLLPSDIKPVVVVQTTESVPAPVASTSTSESTKEPGASVQVTKTEPPSLSSTPGRKNDTHRRIEAGIRDLTRARHDLELAITQLGDEHGTEITALQYAANSAQTNQVATVRDLDRANLELSTQKQHIKSFEEQIHDLQQKAKPLETERDELKNSLERTRTELAETTAKLKALQAKGDALDEEHGKHLDAERDAQRRAMGEKIAQSIAGDLHSINEIRSNEPSSSGCLFLLNVCEELIQRLRQCGVPIRDNKS